ncbi:MAG: WXG100 family type VII secretion target [Nocardioides sp.]
MGSADQFTVDAAELDTVISDVEKTETALETLTTDLESQIAALQSVWDGLAADAQRAAQDEWNDGMVDMRSALTDLREEARAAHSSYTTAASTNVQMWEGLS